MRCISASACPHSNCALALSNCALQLRSRFSLILPLPLALPPVALSLQADEPSSGLSSSAAAVVMRALKRVCASGRTVVATIHQPSADLFAMFDALFLMQVRAARRALPRLIHASCLRGIDFMGMPSHFASPYPSLPP